LSARALTGHLLAETAAVRRTVRALRRTILKAAPTAAEAFKFHVMCYYRADAWLGAIGGNICMIEIKRGEVLLSLIHGAKVPDPAGLMFGKGRYKRFVRVPGPEFARSKPLASLIRAAAATELFD